jgi:hypothetical protein
MLRRAALAATFLSILPACGGGVDPSASTESAVVAATLRIAPAAGASANFGTLLVGNQLTQTFVVTNVGTGQTTTRIAITFGFSAGFAILSPTGGDCVSSVTTLGPGRSCTVRVRFAPTVGGADSSSVGASAQAGGTVKLPLTGVGALPCVKPGPEYTSQNGSVAFYTFSQGSNVVQCGYQATSQNPDKIAHLPTGNGQYFAAVSSGDFAAAQTCGACVEVSRDDGRKVVATVVDECPSTLDPKCVLGHINLSQAAFQQIGSLGEGFLGKGNTNQPQRPTVGLISWRYVPCPVTGNAFARIKAGTQNEIYFENLVGPIRGVIMKGFGALQPYNAWRFGNNVAVGNDVFVTDIDGSEISFTVASAVQNLDQDIGRQFSICQ